MNHDQNLSEVLFFGMRLKAGREEVYSIENEEGQMEICHLTNCALVSDSMSKKPIYVRMKAPDVDSEFVIGALVPGQVYSFTTDLILSPDTRFSHSGGLNDEVHLTGYRTVNSEAMFMGQDLEDTDDEMDEEVEDEEDEDFVVDDDEAELQAVGADEEEAEDTDEDSDEDGEDDDDDDEEEGNDLENTVVRDKVQVKGEKDFAQVAKERAKAREKLLQLHEQTKDIVAHPDALDVEIRALQGGDHFMLGAEDSDSDLEVDEDERDSGDDEEDLGPPEGEEVDDDEEVQRHMQEIMEDDDDDEDDDEENAGAGVGSILQVKQKSTAANNKLRHDTNAEKGSEEEDDEDADPSARAKAVTFARQQREKIEREKQKQQLNGAQKPSNAAGSPAAAQEKNGKKRKASLGDPGDDHATPVQKVAKGEISHPESVNEATRKFAESMFRALKAAGKPMQMAQLSTKVKKPEGAEKMGKVVGKYACFTREAGKDIVSLAE